MRGHRQGRTCFAYSLNWWCSIWSLYLDMTLTTVWPTSLSSFFSLRAASPLGSGLPPAARLRFFSRPLPFSIRSASTAMRCSSASLAASCSARSDALRSLSAFAAAASARSELRSFLGGAGAATASGCGVGGAEFW